MLTKEQLYTYNYVLNQLGKRILPIYFYNKNAKVFSNWQNQICLQSHTLACYYLNKWLNSNTLEYNIQLCEGQFIDAHTKQQYNHSWVYISNITDEEDEYDTDRYICDIARISDHIGFQEVIDNSPERLLKSDREIIELRKYHNWKLFLQENEYYTNKKGIDIIPEIDNMLKEARLEI